MRAVVRSEARLPERVKGHAKLECVEVCHVVGGGLSVQSSVRFPNQHSHGNLAVQVADVTALGAKGTEELMKGCDAVVQCLGHRMTFEGMYKHPRR